jgi:ABC-type lipoprotein release transport system permease subunit
MGLTPRLAWRNLWRHPRRTWLTLGAMVFSNVLLVFMISLQVGMYGLMIENTLKVYTGSLQVQAPGYKDDGKMRQIVPDVESLADKLRAGLDLESVSARGIAFALASSEDRSYGMQIVGVDPRHEPLVSSVPGLIAEGRYLEPGDGESIVIGRVMARNLKVGPGDEITLLGSGLDGSFAAAVVNVVGIFDSSVAEFDRSISYLSLPFFQDMFYMDGAGHQVVVSSDSLSRVDALVAQTEALLPADEGLVVHDWDVLQPGLKQAIQADIGSAFFMYAVLVILVAFSVLNTQLMSVLERTREFGIVMALGVSPGRMGWLVLLETAIMALLGLAAGAVAGALFTYWFTVNGFSYPGMAEMAEQFNLPAEVFPEVTPLSMLIGPAAVFTFSLLATAYPALRLHWLQPVEAMRAA